MKTDADILAERLLTAQSPLGRWRVNLYSTWFRLSWKWSILGTLFLKRIIDIVGSITAILLLSPVFLTIVILIKLEDGGPVIFAQKRVGKFGKAFTMFKFRSMCMDAEKRLKELLAQNQHQDGITFKIKDDPRVTKIGKWLRKLSLDELPQFFNVLKGDMSLVGPRPPVPREVEKYTLADHRRLAVLPGITCLWQIGGRSEIDFSGQVQLDVRYIESRTFWGDIKILLKTVPAVLFSKGAY